MRLIAAGAAVLAAACAGPAPREQAILTPDQAAGARRAIVAWLECEECTSGELEAVVALQERAVPSLIASLEDGPSPASQEAHRRHLVATYARLRTHQAARGGPPITMTEERHVRASMDNYGALYRVRSAIALGVIGGPEARRVLETALRTPQREDVKAAIAAALMRLEKP